MSINKTCMFQNDACWDCPRYMDGCDGNQKQWDKEEGTEEGEEDD